METITITMPDNRIGKLKEMASDFNVTIEELIRLSIESMLLQPEPALQQAMDYILDKNQELYQRLA
jgi:16S rRNA U516 pseudouridylate synthase RsuA-like enzyme